MERRTSRVFRLTPTVREDGQRRQEIVYGLTNLPPARAGAADRLTYEREQWAIENRLHGRRDVTLREDHCQVRKGVAPRILALRNRFLLAVLDFVGGSLVAKQTRLFDAHPQQAIRLLLGSLLTVK